MRSLSTKLVLAFALTSLAGMALAALFVRQFVVSEFDAYVNTTRRAAFVEQAASYYAAHGTWAGVATVLHDVQSSPGQPGRPYDAWQQGGRRGNEPFGLALADAAGMLVVAPGPLRPGQPASASDLRTGTPVTVAGKIVGTVFTLGYAALRNPDEERYLARTELALAAAALAAVLVALVLGLLLARLITRPLRDLTAAARAIASGNLRQHVPVRSRDELGLLATQFNQMSDDLDRANQLRRRMTADIAHDLRTPLTVISGYLEALRDETLRPTPTRFAVLHDETQMLLHLVQDLHTLSLADAGELPLKRQPVAAQQLIERVAATYQHVAAQQGVALTTQANPALPELQVDAEQLVRALGNLVSNALRHTPAGGRVWLAARMAGGDLVIEVADTGSGIPAEHLPNIFERFYRADESRQQATGGSGLGLAIVRSIVEAHGGQISVASSPGQGTTFTIAIASVGNYTSFQPALHIA